MHRTTRVPRLLLWSFPVILAQLLHVAPIAAQGPPGPSKAITAPEAGKPIIVAINATRSFAHPSGGLIKDVKIENPAIARVALSTDAKSVLLTGLVAGNTTMHLTDVANTTASFSLVVQADIEYLKYMLRQAVPTANIEPIPSANNVFILTGTVAKPEDIAVVKATAQSVVGPNLIEAMRVGGVQQVQLDVVIAQVKRTELRRMSVDWFRSGTTLFLGSALDPLSNIASTALVTPPAALGNLARGGPANLVLGTLTQNSSFWFFLQALRTEQLAKFLAEPRLVTMSGKPASFLAGGRLAIPEPSGLGTNAVRFEPFGTRLNFLPIVLGNGKIYLEVEPLVDTLSVANGTSIGGTVVPGFDSQQLHATVELEDGQTFAIGGLIQNTVNNITLKVPILGDMPFLGTLFSTKSAQMEETELLILVTPHLVDGMTCAQLPKLLPSQETRNADDFELFLEGIIEAPRGPRDVCPHGIYQAAYRNSPTAGQFPCGLPQHHGGFGHGGLLNRGCGHNGCGQHCPASNGCCTDGAPMHSAPVYGAPEHGAPVHGAPEHGAPMPGAPAAAPHQGGSTPVLPAATPIAAPKGASFAAPPAALPQSKIDEAVPLPAGAIAPAIPVVDTGDSTSALPLPSMPPAILGPVAGGDNQ